MKRNAQGRHLNLHYTARVLWALLSANARRMMVNNNFILAVVHRMLGKKGL
jgi:hypothetical protein